MERYRQGLGGNKTSEFATVTQRTKRHFYFSLAFAHQELQGVEKNGENIPHIQKSNILCV